MDSTTTRIRRAQPEDAARLALVGQATFLETFAGVLDGADIVAHCAAMHASDYYARALADGETRLWLAERDPGGAPVGFVMTGRCTLPVADGSDDDFEIKRIYLLHRFHGGGLGAALLGAAVDDARAARKRRLLLGVYGRNERAIGFYVKHGFRKVGERQFLVGTRRYDDVVLARPL